MDSMYPLLISSPDDRLNVAASLASTFAMGPGRRAAVWVQGCPLACEGCLAPEWQPFKTARLVHPTTLAEELAGGELLDGLTLSGGEPAFQGRALAEFVRAARRYQPHLNVICFTGFQYEWLSQGNLSEAVGDLLDVVDLLIDGPYLPHLDDGRGLRGSSNQRFIHLTDRLKYFSPEKWMRRVDIRVLDGELLMAGIPTANLLNLFDSPILRMQLPEVTHNERT